MQLVHKIIRYTINLACLTISTGLIIKFLQSLSNDPIYMVAVVPLSILVEVLAQLSLSKGLFNWKNHHKIASVVFLAMFTLYLICFAMLSAIAFFNAEIMAQESAGERVKFAESAERDKWASNNQLIASLNKQLETESKTGYGDRSTAIMEQIAKLKTEQKELESKFNRDSTTQKLIDTFSELALTIGIPANILKIIVFGTLILFIYYGSIVTSWEIDFGVTENKAAVTSVTRSVTGKNKPVTPVTNFVTDKTESVTSFTKSVTPVTNDAVTRCPICNEPFIPKNNKVYCSNKCKQEAYRQREEALEHESVNLQTV